MEDNYPGSGRIEKSLAQRLKDSSKIFAPVGGIIGIVSDLMEPLAFAMHVITVICGTTTIVLFVFYLIRKRKEIYAVVSEYFFNFFIFTIILIFFWILTANSEKGFLADNFKVMSDLQNVLVKNFTSSEEELEEPPVETTIEKPASYYVDIALNQLRVGKSSVENQIVNGFIYHKNGHYELAALVLDSAVKQGAMKYDLFYRYYESMFYELQGDSDAINSRISAAGLSGNELMAVARIDFLYRGLEYYRALDDLALSDKELLAFAQNLKAKSLFADLHHYYKYESFALEHWIPIMKKNQAKLGKNLVNIRDFFFDFQDSYHRFVQSTSHETDQHFVWEWPIADPGKKSAAAMIWKRIISGDVEKVIMNLNQTVKGRVVDESDNPIPDVLVSDFDSFTKISSPEVFSGIATDNGGSFSFTSGLGHLLHFRFIGSGRRYEEVFRMVESDESMTVVMRELK